MFPGKTPEKEELAINLHVKGFHEKSTLNVWCSLKEKRVNE